MKKKKLWIIILSLSLILIIVLSSLTLERGVFMVESYAITKEHYQLYIDDNKAKITSYFYSKYKADSNQDNFWTTDFNGEIPKEVLEKTAKEQIIKDTVTRIEAVKHGIEADVTLNEIQKSLEVENSRRVSGQEIVYGPDQYNIIQYISKTQDNIEDNLMEALLETELKPTREQLKDLYDSSDTSLLDLGCHAKVGIFMYYGMTVGNYPEELEDIWILVKEQWEQQIQPQQIVDNIKLTTGQIIEYDEVSYDSNDLPKDANQLYWLVDNSRALPVGSFSPILNYEASQGLFIMLEKKEYGKATFEDSHQLLRNKWINEKFEEYIDEKIKKYL